MADRVSQSKQEEQYPLLKVDWGAGDGGHPVQNPTQVTPEWGVAGMPKQSWLFRWPEFISTCWMSVILLGMSLLVFYGVYMGAYRQQPIVIVKCNENNSKPASDVFYHHIVQRESYVPFMKYSEYLSRMAMHYPYLRFHVFFLIDDSLQTTTGPRYNRFISKLISYQNGFSTKVDENIKRDIDDFKRKYQNVNVTIMPLSRYMTMTPLKYKWRMIPISYLPFYARIYTVWQNGGIGIDLTTFNNIYNHRQPTDRRVTAILKQHNDGIKPEDYTRVLNKIDQDEENAFFQTFYGLIHQILNETRSFFNKTVSFSVTTENNLPLKEPLIRTHRNKREIENVTNKDRTSEGNKFFTNHEDLQTANIMFTNNLSHKYGTPSDPVVNMDKITNTETRAPTLKSSNDSQIGFNILKNLDNNMSSTLNNSEVLVRNISEIPQVVLFYDFTLLSDGIASSYLVDEAIPHTETKQMKGSEFSNPTQNGKLLPHLSIDPEGMFISAVSRLHPFLGHIISAGCQRMPPKFAIQDALKTQCSGLFKEDVYCNNIYVL